MLNKVLALFSLAAITSTAAVIEYQVVLDEVMIDALFNLRTTKFRTSTPPAPPSQLNPGDEFRVTYNAPEGLLFRILPIPSNIFPYEVSFYWSADGFPSAVNSAPATVSLNRPSQSLLPEPTGSFDYTNDNRFALKGSFFTQDLTFKSITVSTTIPSGFSKSFADLLVDPYISVVFFGTDFRSTPVALGDFVADVPEPGSWLLITTSASILVLARRKLSRSRNSD
jgi:hypothetical protein